MSRRLVGSECWSPTSHVLNGPIAPSLAENTDRNDKALTPMEVFFGARPRDRRFMGTYGSSTLVAATRAEMTLSNDQLCHRSTILRAFVSDPAVVTKLALCAAIGKRREWRSLVGTVRRSEGKLLPTFRDDCPVAIRDLAHRCLSLDPATRPTAL
ncbi:hypothetical protein CCR75_000774 [Bremia lactucae]|uniref:Uncharacterized protein n=1 Tax=Bremia lactucae TaxID=4779 RepID=A0A976IHZ7_BRELC|nr:hypothetical protein CCR75_000774 [Bremia lactucae]